MYTPILRNRRSETLAVRALVSEVKGKCIPLFDLAAPTKAADQATVQAYLERNITSMGKALPGFSQVLIDSSELDPDVRVGRLHPLLKAAREVADRGCIPVAVTGLHRDDGHMNAVRKIRSSLQVEIVCYRLDATDIGTASQSYRQLLSSLADIGIDSSDVILLLDLQSVYGMAADSVAAQVSRFISRAAESQWAGLIVAGYGVPDQLTAAISVREQGYLARLEQEVYARVAGATSLDSLWFGDYATVSPTHVELDWRLVSKVMSPKAIYALTDSWFVVRGGPFATHAKGYKQYHQIAEEIVALEEFSGPGYSSGDAYIHECATGAAASTGNPSSWITACVNHHITLTANEHA